MNVPSYVNRIVERVACSLRLLSAAPIAADSFGAATYVVPRSMSHIESARGHALYLNRFTQMFRPRFGFPASYR